MTREQISRVEEILEGECIEFCENPHGILNSFLSPKYGVVFVEQTKRDRSKELIPIPNYSVCVESIKEWHDIYYIKDVIQFIEDWVNTKK